MSAVVAHGRPEDGVHARQFRQFSCLIRAACSLGPVIDFLERDEIRPGRADHAGDARQVQPLIGSLAVMNVVREHGQRGRTALNTVAAEQYACAEKREKKCGESANGLLRVWTGDERSDGGVSFKRRSGMCTSDRSCG